jgi:hypothetical protein
VILKFVGKRDRHSIKEISMKNWMTLGFFVLLWGAGAEVSLSQTVPDRLPDSTGNWLNYPYGTRVYSDGAVQTPRGDRLTPAAVIPHGDGSTTYYYSNGTHLTVNENTINPLGTPLRTGTVNGGLNQGSLNRGSLNRGSLNSPNRLSPFGN